MNSRFQIKVAKTQPPLRNLVDSFNGAVRRDRGEGGRGWRMKELTDEDEDEDEQKKIMKAGRE